MKQKPSSRRRSSTKSVLRLPDLEHAKAAVLNSLNSADAKRGYCHAIDEFVDWYCSEPRLAFNRIVVLRYRSHLESRQLAPGTINLRLGAVRRLAYEAADCGLLSADLAAGIRRVKGVKKLGMRLGNWLTAEQGHALWQTPDSQRLKGKRDRALLALLLACGLRRHEAVALTLDHLQQREQHCAIVDLVGKGGHVRTVPVPDWVRTELDNWLAAAAIDRGKLFRVNKVGRTWGDGMTVKAVWHIVKESARASEWRSWHRTICEGPVLGFATRREASWSRSNFFWGTFRCKRPNAIMRSGTLCRVASVSACQSDHFSWITAHKIS
jgi:site-specific recombinase XerD